VVPAAHYTCGGVVTDLHGRTDLPGLYAVGETTYTGLHGANRLASNSLLECVVLGRTCAADILKRGPTPTPQLPAWDESQVENADEQVVIAHNWDELRLLMWNYVGIVRTTKRLERALHRIKLLRTEIDDYYANFRVNRDLLELRNLVDCAELIVRSALMRARAAACTTAVISRRRQVSGELPDGADAAGARPQHRQLLRPGR
jgi:L-aspartate oxidase